jgi:hypothetical protein
MADNDRKLTSAEADKVLARAASLDAEGEGATLSAEEIRESALAAGIAPHAVERALKEATGMVVFNPEAEQRYMGLRAIPRSSATVSGAPTNVTSVAKALRAALGPDAKISEELGTVRARMGETIVTVVPGKSTLVSVSSDQTPSIAVTGLAAGIGGVIVALFITLAMGLGGSATAVATAIAGGGVAGIVGWRALWSRYLANKARQVEAIAAVTSRALSAPDT